MNGRRTRAAATKPSAKATNTVNLANGLAGDDHFFASPKRKDCKLNEPNGPSAMTSSQSNAVPNGKQRAPKTASVSSKHKQSFRPITEFLVNGHHYKGNAPVANDDHQPNAVAFDLTDDSRDFPALPPSPMIAKKKHAQPVNNHVNDSRDDAIEFASPKLKLSNGSSVKPTTPHRIVALMESPTKKQRLNVNPVDVFEQLNIAEDASGKSKSTKTTRKNESQRTRRKLIAQETENVTNESKVVATSADDIVPLPHTGVASGTVASAVDAKKPILNMTVDPSAQQNTTNNKKLMVAPSRPPRATQLTDFFPIRRSARKTQKMVEQEHLRYIEMAIEKQLEDGLVVETFPHKGRGIVAGRPFARGEFVVEYIGELIDTNEADRREESYAKNVDFGCYMYYFKHKEQHWCIDATAETGKLGRLVNHSRNGNLMTKIVSHNGYPHLVLLAKEDIKAGVELTYDYGDRRREALIHHPWLAF